MTDDDLTFLRVRNWEKYQYRSDKTLPWIRTHDAQLEDYDYTSLSDAERGILHDVRLLANRVGNKIPNDPAWIARVTRSRSKSNALRVVPKLITLGFLEPWTANADGTVTERVPIATRTRDCREQNGYPTVDPHGTKSAANTHIQDAHTAHTARPAIALDRDRDRENSPTPLTRKTQKQNTAAEAWIRNVGWTLTDEAPNDLDHELRERRGLDDLTVRRLTELARTIATQKGAA